ncbi:PfkB family carbohydrate kinase [Thiohalocapsa sp. ML1]|jgi:fructokinase|uniref:PfkB family carbohydrate kinase n=1 Tax=Thiohalocapsa sp. ML1 TaxID=1431688 RepID=UPI000732219C|nr:PfkB family carbohydrate kinase [Thiohalocapsa sp. ML1]
MPFDPNLPPVVFGEALFDCFPDGARVLGGAPFNVAWHLAALGAAPLFVSRVGDDALGEQIGSAMRAHGMTLAALQRDAKHPTGRVEVSLAAGEPSYDIVADSAYDCIDAAALPSIPAGTLLYHGTLATRQAASATALAVLRGETDAVFMDVNLRAPWWTQAGVRALLDGARWVKLNADELALLAPAGDDAEARAAAFVERHGLELVVVTLGEHGAFGLAADGSLARVRPGAAVQVVDAVGAGDGFAAVLILGLLHGWPLGETLSHAQAFASAIVSRRGAVIDDPVIYADFARRFGL